MTERELLTRNVFLEMLETQWGRYVPTLEALTEEDRQRFAQQEGYNSLNDLLVHITAWMWKTYEVVTHQLENEPLEGDWQDVDAFNARAIQRMRSQTFDQVKADFENARTALGGLIAEMPADAVNQPDIYKWLYDTIVVHYREHEPPGEPQVPAEQYTITG